MTAVANAIFTAAQFNTHVRDNLLETAPAKATTAGSIFVASGTNSISERIRQRNSAGSSTTTSTTYTNLAAGALSVTAVTGTSAFVTVGATMSHNAANGTCHVSWDVTSATTLAASDSWMVSNREVTAGWTHSTGRSYLVTGLTAGSNVFTAKYKITTVGTGTFTDRDISVIPF